MARREFDEILRAVRTVKSNRPEDSVVEAVSITRGNECSDSKETRGLICRTEGLRPEFASHVNSLSNSRGSTQETGQRFDSEKVASKQKLDSVAGIHNGANGVSKSSSSPKSESDSPTMCHDLVSAKHSELERVKEDILKYKKSEEALLAMLSEQRSSAEQRFSAMAKEVKNLKHQNHELQSECNQFSERITVIKNEKKALQTQWEGVVAESSGIAARFAICKIPLSSFKLHIEHQHYTGSAANKSDC
jgi:chromosome segregation ATPase